MQRAGMHACMQAIIGHQHCLHASALPSQMYCARAPMPKPRMNRTAEASAELLGTFYPVLAALVLEAQLREEGDEAEPGGWTLIFSL